jgi:L-fuculose-phosphate aldolase
MSSWPATHGPEREARLRHEVVAVCRLLYERGLVAGQDGNVSVRLGDDRLLVTPAGRAKGSLAPDDLVVTTLDGDVILGGRASSEIGMHLALYARRIDVAAVVHAHPPVATGFAVAGIEIDPDVLPETIFQVGDVALVPFAMPGTDALPRSLEPFAATHDAFLLSNHGATTVGRSLGEAHLRMESLEHAARILLAARQLGSVRPLDAESVRALRAARAAVRDTSEGGLGPHRGGSE